MLWERPKKWQKDKKQTNKQTTTTKKTLWFGFPKHIDKEKQDGKDQKTFPVKATGEFT